MNKKKIFTIIIFVVVLFIPLIYSFFYLKSYWNPYENLSDMKIAVVNLDEGKDNKNRGNDFVQNLYDSNTFCFETVSSEDAKKGMEEGKYYATIELPSNFTKCLESASTTDKQIAKVSYSPNQATNYLATQMINSAIKTVQLNLQTQVDKEIITTLSNKLEEVPNNLEEIKTGSETILNGSESLNSGIGQINEGAEQLESSYAEFNNGINTAYQGSQTLDGGIKQVDNGISSLQGGGRSLEDAINKINSGANSLSEEGENGIVKLAGGISTLNTGAKNLNEGVTAYVDGSTKLAKGTNNYIENNQTLINNVNSYIDGVDSLNTNTEGILKQLVDIGDNSSDPNIKKIANQANQLLNNFSIIEQSGGKLKQAGTQLTNSNTELKNGAETIINSSNSVKQGATSLYTGTSELLNSTSNLNEITNGINSLQTALTSLKQGSASLNNGIDTLKTGTTTLTDGSTNLTSGLETLNTNSNKILNAITTIHEGTESANSGSKQLVTGIDTFNSSIEEGIENTEEELKTLDGLAEFSEEPVQFETKEYGKVESYGIAFTPLFLCIGLWVGALMCYVIFYYDHDNRFGILGINSKNKLLQNALYIGIGAIEGLLTGALLKLGLNFEVQNLCLYYFVSALIGITFTSIIQFLIRNFGDIGKFIALIILVLQLAAAGGTFPIETIDNAFRLITPYLPMTYCIKLLKEILIPTTTNFKGTYILILLLIILVSCTITVVCDILRKSKNET